MDNGGIINIFKPAGMTSFDVVFRVRRLFHIKRAGHCGTLDPFATGVLPVCLGRATGVVRYMENYDKTYRAVLAFGTRTDTQDCTGRVIGGHCPDDADKARLLSTGFADLREAIREMEGESWQLPPMYSAVKKDGVPLYKLARKGIEAERERRRINIYSIQLADVSIKPDVTATIDVRCSKGTYIRTLCDDLGVRLSFGAHARELCRTACGPFLQENSVTLEELEETVKNTGDPWQLFGRQKGFFRMDEAIADMPKRYFSEENSLKLIQGQRVAIPDETAADTRFAAYSLSGKWLGVVKPDSLPAENPAAEADVFYVKAERIFTDAQTFAE